MIRAGEMPCKLLIYITLFKVPLFHSPTSSASSDEAACFIIRPTRPHPPTGAASSTDNAIRPVRDSNHEPCVGSGVPQTTRTRGCRPGVKPRQRRVDAVRQTTTRGGASVRATCPAGGSLWGLTAVKVYGRRRGVLPSWFDADRRMQGFKSRRMGRLSASKPESAMPGIVERKSPGIQHALCPPQRTTPHPSAFPHAPSRRGGEWLPSPSGPLSGPLVALFSNSLFCANRLPHPAGL